MQVTGRKPKVFILGISGFLGYQLALHLRDKFLVSGACFSHWVGIPGAQVYGVDITRPELLETLLRVQSPDCIVNAMGVRDRGLIDRDPKLTDSINVLLPVSYAVLANKMKIPFVQLSCAEVFAGDEGPYQEDAYHFTMTDPLGKQKVAAESYIRAQTLESTIVRVGRVVGLGPYHRPSDFDRVRARFAAQQAVEFSSRQYSYLSVDSFVRGIEQVLLHQQPGRHKLYHLGGANLPEIAFYAGYAEMALGNSKLVKPSSSEAVGNFGLVCESFAKQFPDWTPETPGTLYLNLLKSLCPGVGIRKWQKTLRTP